MAHAITQKEIVPLPVAFLLTAAVATWIVGVWNAGLMEEIYEDGIELRVRECTVADREACATLAVEIADDCWAQAQPSPFSTRWSVQPTYQACMLSTSFDT